MKRRLEAAFGIAQSATLAEPSWEPLGTLLKVPWILCTHRSSKYVSSASKPFPSDGVTKGIVDNLYSSCMKLQVLQGTALSNGCLEVVQRVLTVW